MSEHSRSQRGGKGLKDCEYNNNSQAPDNWRGRDAAVVKAGVGADVFHYAKPHDKSLKFRYGNN